MGDRHGRLIGRRQTLLSRRAFVGGGAAAVASPWVRQARSAAACGAPVAYYSPAGSGDCSDTRGRAAVAPGFFDPAQTMVALLGGQSIWASFSQVSHYAPSSGRLYEFNPFDGKIYPCDGYRVLGANGPADRLSICPYLFDVAALTKGWQNIIMANTCFGGLSSLDLCPAGAYYARSQSVFRQLCAIGLPITDVFVVQGQQDVALNTDPANFVAYWNWTAQAWRQGEQFGGSITFGLGVHWTDVSNDANGAYTAAGRAIRTAQYNAALQMGARVGPDDDQFLDPDRVENVHWNDNGRFKSMTTWNPVIRSAPPC